MSRSIWVTFERFDQFAIVEQNFVKYGGVVQLRHVHSTGIDVVQIINFFKEASGGRASCDDPRLRLKSKYFPATIDKVVHLKRTAL